jgi:hypothetical protein
VLGVPGPHKVHVRVVAVDEVAAVRGAEAAHLRQYRPAGTAVPWLRANIYNQSRQYPHALQQDCGMCTARYVQLPCSLQACAAEHAD